MSNTFQISGRKIRDARLKAGLTQNQLAHAIKTSERNIVRWETNANDPRMEYVAAIAQATEHDVSFFLGDEPDESDDDAEAALFAAAPLSRDEFALYGALTARIVGAQARGVERSRASA